MGDTEHGPVKDALKSFEKIQDERILIITKHFNIFLCLKGMLSLEGLLSIELLRKH